MKLTMDDPKLTAYALGELDAAERADIARERCCPRCEPKPSPHR
jgi:hypothetical protein